MEDNHILLEHNHGLWGYNPAVGDIAHPVHLHEDLWHCVGDSGGDLNMDVVDMKNLKNIMIQMYQTLNSSTKSIFKKRKQKYCLDYEN